MSFDLIRYQDQKEKGLVKIEQDGETSVLVTKHFDSFTGEPLEDLRVPLNEQTVSQLKAYIESSEATIKNANALLEDMNG